MGLHPGRRAAIDQRAAVLHQQVGRHAAPAGVEEEMIGGREDAADRDVRWPAGRPVVGVDAVEMADRLAVRVGVGAEIDEAEPAPRVEHAVEGGREPAQARRLVDVRSHGAGHGAVMGLGRHHEGAMVRFDGLVRDHARQDQLAAAARAPVVGLRLAHGKRHVRRRDFLVQPDRGPAGGHPDEDVAVRLARLVLEEGDTEPLHAREVLPPELERDVAFGHREDLAVGADDARVAHARGLDGIEHRRQELRGRRRAELVVDDDRQALVRADECRERRARMGVLERRRGGLGRPRERGRLVRVDRREEVLLRNLQGQGLAIDHARIVRRADGQRVEGFVGDRRAIGPGHRRPPVPAPTGGRV